MSIIRVALDVPVNTLFDYLLPDDEVTRGDVGARVRVPFGKNALTGVIMEVIPHPLVPTRRLRAASHVLRDVPPLPKNVLDLFRFCSEYYHHPLGEVVMNGLPTRLRSNKPFIQESHTDFQYRLTPTGQSTDLSAIPVRSVVKRRLLARLKEQDAISMTETREVSSRAVGAIKEFMASGWVEEILVPPGGSRLFEESAGLPVLTPAQQSAVNAIAAKTSEFNAWLLHGVTGSGKTEVYLRLISLLLRQGRQTLVLVPEINLTPQLEASFRTRFPSIRMVSLHSALNATERAAGWLQAQQAEAQLILGTRLAVFTPLPKLGLIIVDEEHDASFKQQEGLRYSARDVAVFRAKQADVPVILGSATPSLESYYAALSGRYTMLRLPFRAAKNASLPVVRYIDTRKAKSEDGLMAPVIAALERCLALNQQSLVFINRRGYAPVLLCKSCGWSAACHRCASRLVVHLREKQMRCHHCGHREAVPNACPECGDQDIAPFGHGTQRVAATLEERFPDARIMRIDRDSTRRKDAWQQMLKDIQEKRVDILVGTQIMAKGHDFPNLALVAILNSDASLYSTDFRASERLFAQLMQVAGRAGRAGIEGEVLIQTEFAGHPLYHALQKQDYDALARTLLEERRAAGFPPFVYQALLRAEAPEISATLSFLKSAAAVAQAPDEVEVFDPVPAQMSRLKGMERACLLAQSASRKKLQTFLAGWRSRLDALPSRKVRWTLDVDPLEF